MSRRRSLLHVARQALDFLVDSVLSVDRTESSRLSVGEQRSLTPGQVIASMTRCVAHVCMHVESSLSP